MQISGDIRHYRIAVIITMYDRCKSNHAQKGKIITETIVIADPKRQKCCRIILIQNPDIGYKNVRGKRP